MTSPMCHGSQRRAFTLLELTISMAVVAILVVLLFSSLHVGLKAREITENAVAANRSADLVMEVIRADIQSALPPSRGTFAQAFEGTSNPNGDGFDVLDFFTSAPTSLHMVNGASVADGDIKEIVLTAYQPAGSKDHVLVRRTWNNLLDSQYQPQYQQQNLTNMDEEVLCRHVVALTFQYYSTSQLWMPTWDSTAVQPVNTLPTAVQVTLQLQSPEKNSDGTPKIVTYTRIFQLPCIGASNDAATTTTTGTSSGGTQ